VFGGTPAVLVGLLPETAREEFQRFTVRAPTFSVRLTDVSNGITRVVPVINFYYVKGFYCSHGSHHYDPF